LQISNFPVLYQLTVPTYLCYHFPTYLLKKIPFVYVFSVPIFKNQRCSVKIGYVNEFKIGMLKGQGKEIIIVLKWYGKIGLN